MRVMHGGVLARVTAWIGHRRVGVGGMGVKLCVLGRIGGGGGANVGIVGDMRSHRTIGGVLPAVVSNRGSRNGQWRKLTRPLGV